MSVRYTHNLKQLTYGGHCFPVRVVHKSNVHPSCLGQLRLAQYRVIPIAVDLQPTVGAKAQSKRLARAQSDAEERVHRAVGISLEPEPSLDA